MSNDYLEPFKQSRYKMICCAVLSRECYFCASVAGNTIDVLSIEQGLHDMGQEKMSSRLQQEIDKVDPEKYEAILLGYGLCNNGTVGLTSKLPLVIARAHDCITLLLGSKERYQDVIQENTKTFFESAGWLEQYEDYMTNPESTTTLLGLGKYADYVRDYGAENADYLIKTLGGGLKSYEKFTFIDTIVGDQKKLKEHTKTNALKNNWEYDELEGDTSLLLRMMNGQWDKEDFLVVQPGQSIQPSYTGTVIEIKG